MDGMHAHAAHNNGSNRPYRRKIMGARHVRWSKLSSSNFERGHNSQRRISFPPHDRRANPLKSASFSLQKKKYCQNILYHHPDGQWFVCQCFNLRSSLHYQHCWMLQVFYGFSGGCSSWDDRVLKGRHRSSEHLRPVSARTTALTLTPTLTLTLTVRVFQFRCDLLSTRSSHA